MGRIMHILQSPAWIRAACLSLQQRHARQHLTQLPSLNFCNTARWNMSPTVRLTRRRWRGRDFNSVLTMKRELWEIRGSTKFDLRVYLKLHISVVCTWLSRIVCVKLNVAPTIPVQSSKQMQKHWVLDQVKVRSLRWVLMQYDCVLIKRR